MEIGYSNIACSYNELYREEQLAKIEAVMRYFKLPITALLLDIGCGTGIASERFKCKKFGLDNSIPLLKLAKGLDRVGGLAERLPFKTKAFDAVICLTAIHNFSNPLVAVEEMLRVSNQQVVSVLKRSKDYENLCNIIRDLLWVEHEIDSDKDTIFITRFQISTKQP